jgi:hypothetical protein
MLKTLSNFLVWAVLVILLFNIWVWGNNGYRGWAIGGIVVLVAIMVLWNRAAKPDETLAIPENRKAKSDLFRILSTGLWALWVVGIGIGAGIFGKIPYLPYLFMAIAAISIAIIVFMRIWKVDNSN